MNFLQSKKTFFLFLENHREIKYKSWLKNYNNKLQNREHKMQNQCWEKLMKQQCLGTTWRQKWIDFTATSSAQIKKERKQRTDNEQKNLVEIYY